jgi:hypothetical protein
MIDRRARSRPRPGNIGRALVGLLVALVVGLAALAAPPLGAAGSTSTSAVRLDARSTPARLGSLGASRPDPTRQLA